MKTQLAPDELFALLVIDELAAVDRAGVAIGTLAAELDVPPPEAARIADALERDGWIASAWRAGDRLLTPIAALDGPPPDERPVDMTAAGYRFLAGTPAPRDGARP
ncbi:MAG: hypothetical protein AB7N54_20085 [Alphaproteobacteria bacterium]